MSNVTEVTIKSSVVEMITSSAESNENSCEIASERCEQFAGPALRRHSSDTALQTASAGDAADVGLELPSAGDAADDGLELPSAASTHEPVMTDLSQPAADDLGRQTMTARPSSSGPTEIIVANYESPTFRFYILLLNKAITSPIANDVITDTPFASSPPESSPSVCLPSESSRSTSSPAVSSPLQSSHGFADPMRRRTCSMPNVHVRFCADDIRHVSSTQQSSHGLVDPPKRRACSMPNIHVRFCSSRDLSELADVQTAVQAASVLSDVPEDQPCDETEPAAEAAPKRPKSRTALWKRTKRFVRRMFCCA